MPDEPFLVGSILQQRVEGEEQLEILAKVIHPGRGSQEEYHGTRRLRLTELEKARSCL